MTRFLPKALFVAVCFTPMVSQAHVFPISYGTLALASGKAQLRLRMSVHNLHPALEAFTRGHLEMKDEGYDTQLMDAYFKGRLELVSPKGQVLRFRIEQQEIGIEEIVFILQAPLKDLKGWKLRNTVLFEQSRDQKNYVTVEQGGRRLGLIFDAQHPLLSLDAP